MSIFFSLTKLTYTYQNLTGLLADFLLYFVHIKGKGYAKKENSTYNFHQSGDFRIIFPGCHRCTKCTGSTPLRVLLSSDFQTISNAHTNQLAHANCHAYPDQYANSNNNQYADATTLLHNHLVYDARQCW